MSFAPTYACFGCVDFANNLRTKRYIEWACRAGKFNGDAPPTNWLCTCPSDDENWTNPIDDGACWYDPLIPESEDFLGVVVHGSSNVKSSSFKREISDGINGGSVLGLPTISGKQMMLEVYLYATSQAGMNYGIQWLRRQFEGNQNCPQAGSTCASCQGQMLTLRVSCPDPRTLLDPEDPNYIQPPLDTGLHSWSAAGTIDGFAPIDDEFPMGRRNCEKVTAGTITIATESFSSYSTEPINSVDVDISGAFTALGNCLLDSGLPTLDDVCCPICSIGCDPCTTDPGCDCLPPFVLEPEVVTSFAPCFSDPVCRCVGAVAIENIPAGYDVALRMILKSGWDPLNPTFQKFGMRNFVFRVFENPSTETNPAGLPLPTDLESYEYLTSRLGPCAEVGVSWMPAGSELVIDGLSGKSWLKCNGKCVDHSGRVDTISGSIFPLKSRCTNLVVTVEWDCLNSQSRDAAETILSGLSVESYLGFNL